MTSQEAQKLLGGYATGTLTDAEQQALFAAALEDQELFDALAREQSLRDLLRDPASKAQLLAAVDARPARRWSWWPGAVAVSMAAAAAVAILAVRVNVRNQRPAEVAQVQALLTPPAPSPVGPLAVVPVPNGQPRRPFVPPAMARPARPAPLPEPPKVDMPKALETAELKGVIGGVPPSPPPPLARLAAEPRAEKVTPAAAPAVNMFRDGSAQFGVQTGAQAELQGKLQSAAAAARPSARTLFYGTGNRAGAAGNVAGFAKDAAQPANAGVRYSILRKEAAGNFVEVDPADLKVGDTVALRITPNTSGFLSVGGATPVPVSAMTPHTTAPLAAGQSEVRIVFAFARQPQSATAGVQTVSLTEDRSTYAANPLPGQPVNIVVKLQYK